MEEKPTQYTRVRVGDLRNIKSKPEGEYGKALKHVTDSGLPNGARVAVPKQLADLIGKPTAATVKPAGTPAPEGK